MNDINLPSLDELMGEDDTPKNKAKSLNKTPQQAPSATDDANSNAINNTSNRISKNKGEEAPVKKQSKFLTNEGKPVSLSNVTDDVEEDDEEEFYYEEKNNKGKIAAIGAGVVALALAGLMFFHPFSNDQKVGNTPQNSDSMPSDLANKLAKKVPSKVNFWESSGSTKYPVELSDWQLTPFVNGDNSILKNVNNKYANTSLAVSSSRLPSTDQGFTSDPSKMKLPDGTLNPLYSSVTREDYQNAVETDIERLINPVFGDWKQFQYASGDANNKFRITTLSDMFSQDWLDKNQSKKPSEYMPVYADWNANDYGMGNTLLSTGPRWVGVVQNTTSKFTFDTTTQQYNSDVIANIKYSAWTKDENVVTKTGVLKLHIITKTNNGKKAQVLISEASLKVS